MLHIHPAELAYQDDGAEYISLINKTDDEVFYFISYYYLLESLLEDHDTDQDDHDTDQDDDVESGYFTHYLEKDQHDDYKGVVQPQSTRAVLVSVNAKKPYQVGVMMISGGAAKDLYDNYTYDGKPEELMHRVREKGGKAHQALVAYAIRDKVTMEQKEVVT